MDDTFVELKRFQQVLLHNVELLNKFKFLQKEAAENVLNDTQDLNFSEVITITKVNNRRGVPKFADLEIYGFFKPKFEDF